MSEIRRINELFHKLWGKAHDGPDYDKKEWIELQKLMEKELPKEPKRSQHEIREDLLNSRPLPDKCPTCGRTKDQKVAPPDKSIPGIQMGEVCTDAFHGELTVEDLMEMGM